MAARTPLSHNPGMKNMERAFAERPEILAAWVQLNSAIKARMDLRRYELATLAAARRLRSSYCCLAHGTVFLEHFALRHLEELPRADELAIALRVQLPEPEAVAADASE